MKDTVYRKTKEDKALFIRELSAVFAAGVTSGELTGPDTASMVSAFYYLLTCVALSSDMISYEEALAEMDGCFTVFWRGIASA